MAIDKTEAARLLDTVDLGSSVAESDTLLQIARVETSVFDDVLADRVDLIPGTKGSGKTALYRIFVDFLSDHLLQLKKVVIAHGVSGHTDPIFLAYKNEFEKLSEEDFIDFWSVYLISLAYEQFIRDPRFSSYLDGCDSEIKKFRSAYNQARIPEFDKRKTLREILAWTLAVLKSWRPSLKYTPPGDVGQFEMALFGKDSTSSTTNDGPTEDEAKMPRYIARLQSALDEVLNKANLSLWLMIDRLDELFPRRSALERKALRALLRTIPYFQSGRIRVKVFLRDDIFEQVVAGKEGFTALTHVTARTANTLRWSEDQILTLIVRRLYASDTLRQYFVVDMEIAKASTEYQKQCFYFIFPNTVYGGSRKSSTLRWLYNHTQDGRGVATPRDVIDLVTKACQWQRDEFHANTNGTTERLITGAAIRYGMDELSRRKRTTLLEAEFPHLWPQMKKLVGGGTEYSERAAERLFGKKPQETIEDLESIGVLYKATRGGRRTFKVPALYRKGLELTQKFVAI
jgi:hypothetical protein